MRIDPDVIEASRPDDREIALLAAEVRRLQAVINSKEPAHIDNEDWLRRAIVSDKIAIAKLEAEIERLRPTDAEREAIRRAADTLGFLQADYGKTQTEKDAHTLLELLERLKCNDH
jgi:uncharacterized small protein (DUF1192 family)